MIMMNKKAYTELIEQDLEFLNARFKGVSPEVDHIKLVLCRSIDLYYLDKTKDAEIRTRAENRDRAIAAFRTVVCPKMEEEWDCCQSDCERDCNIMSDFQKRITP